MAKKSRLHIPRPTARPGEEPDFSYLDLSPAGSVDKPALDYDAVRRRAMQFRSVGNLWLTNAPTFVTKALLFPNVVFVVGVDTVTRIAEPRYYQNDVERRDRAIEQLIARNSRFLVFGRLRHGRFCGLSDLDVPATLRTICDDVPAHAFREDVSSTELREREAK